MVNYQMRFAPDYSELRVYSIGPDRHDGCGIIPYDPTNGMISSGDITHHVPLENYRALMEQGPDPEKFPVYNWKRKQRLDRLIETQQGLLSDAQQVVHYWALHHRRMPKSWEEIAETIDGFVPAKDVFADHGEPLRFLARDSVAVVYSVGPDGKDDGGTPFYDEMESLLMQGLDPTKMDGDMVRTIAWEEIKGQIERLDKPQAVADEDPYVVLITAQSEETGRDNALMHYQRAALLSPKDPEGAMQEQLTRLMVDGQWDKEYPMLRAYLWAWEPAFAQIRKGVALDHAEGLSLTSLDEDTHLPDVLALQRAARALVAQGKYHDARGEIDLALECYLAAIHMGRDLGGKNATLLSALMSVAIQGIGQAALSSLVDSGQLDSDQLQRTQSFLGRIEETHLGLVEALRIERIWVELNADRLIADLEQSSEEEFRNAESLTGKFQALTQLGNRTASIRDVRLYKQERTALLDAALETLTQEPHQFDFEGFQERIDAMEEGFTSFLSGIFSGLHRFNFFISEDIMIAKRRLILTQVALERYKLEHGTYPENLDGLLGAFMDALPTDPFSGEPFRYRVTEGGAGYSMHSLGPDKLDNPEAGEYDSRKGTMSGGVIY
jgi:tetratricopeptide (TPR) repeat protein